MSSSKSADAPAPRGRPNSRELMLDAAVAVVMEQGAAKLSLDAVARRAGASKGGVMYNFPTKEALLEALIDRIAGRNFESVGVTRASLPDVPGRDLAAYVLNSTRALDEDDRISAELVAVVHGNTRLMQRWASYISARYEIISRDVPPERAALVHLATEGLWFTELLQVSPFTPEVREQVVQLLVRMATGADQPAAAQQVPDVTR